MSNECFESSHSVKEFLSLCCEESLASCAIILYPVSLQVAMAWLPLIVSLARMVPTGAKMFANVKECHLVTHPVAVDGKSCKSDQLAA